MNKQRKLPKKRLKAKRGKWVVRSVRPEVCFDDAEMLVDFSYHPQTHDWGWISFYLKEEAAWDIILALTKVDFF